MIQKMASPNHRIIVDPSILAQATARRQVTSEFSDDLFVQLHHRKALPLHPYPQMCGRAQVCLRGPHTVTFCMKSLGEIIHVSTRWFSTESVQGAVSFEDRKSTRLNSSHVSISYAVSCLKKKSSRRR